MGHFVFLCGENRAGLEGRQDWVLVLPQAFHSCVILSKPSRSSLGLCFLFVGWFVLFFNNMEITIVLDDL